LGGSKRNEMIERSGGRATFPQIFIGGAHVGGCDDLVALDASGKLDAMLGG
jgi:glutaredoxin 3